MSAQSPTAGRARTETAAQLALTDRLPDWTPEDVFSPLRLIDRAPLFLSGHDQLWAIARSLSRRLRAVTNEAADVYSQAAVEASAPLAPAAGLPCAAAVSAGTTEWAILAGMAAFRRLSRDDLLALLLIAHAWRLPAGGVLFEEGSLTGSCYVVVEGRVDISLVVGHRRHLLSTIGPGTILGEMSLLEGLPRSATCSARTAALVLEFPRDRVEAMLSARSPLALAFLGLLTDKLVATLRAADRRRLRLSGARGRPDPESPVL